MERTDDQRVRVKFSKALVACSLAFTRLCHPERSRFSGVAKDLPLNRPNALAKLHHYQSTGT